VKIGQYNLLYQQIKIEKSHSSINAEKAFGKTKHPFMI
jgi:hypothetical protein